MPVELTIVETTVELGQTNVEVILESSSEPGPAGPGVPTGGTDGQVLTKTSATDYATAWEDSTGGAGVTDADYLVGTAHGDLSAEIVVGTSPGGELGGTWASPTVDASHSGSTHAAVQAAAEATAAAALGVHTADTTAVHGIVDTSALALTANVQPLDSDLTAIAALTTTAFGRGLLELANQAALLSAAGAAAASHAHAGEDITSGTVADARIASTIARDSEVTSAISALSSVYQPLDSDLTAVAALTTTAFGRAFLAFADEAAFKAGVNLEAGTDFPAMATFNDHSARHEDGGADEISIAGLAGTPTDLQTHLDDTAAAHAATAISFTPDGSIAATTVQAAIVEVRDEAGGSALTVKENGAVVDATVNALDFLGADFDLTESPEDEVNIVISSAIARQADLDAHITDAADAHDASAVSVADALGVYTGTDVEAVLQEMGVWASYTPALTASSSNPTLGSGSAVAGRWMRIGKMAIVQAHIIFGSSGTAAGSGTYRVSLPFTVGASALPEAGSGIVFDSSASDSWIVLCEPAAGTTYTTMFISQSITAGAVTHAAPLAWAASDVIKIFLTTEIA